MARRRGRAGVSATKAFPKLGTGKRFAAIAKAAKAGGARDPKAVAAAIGIKKYGKARMAQMAAVGRKRKG